MAAAAVAAGVPPATAATDVARDPARDVVKVAIPSGDESDAPANQTVDVTRFTTRHRGTRVRLVVEARELGDHIALQLRIRTPRKSYFGYVENEGGTVFKGLSTKNGSAVCAGRIGAGVSPSADTVSFTVPRGCIGKPRWVRTGALASTGTSDNIWYDDARRDGSFDIGSIRLGPRVGHN